jgi:hypothetical protein
MSDLLCAIQQPNFFPRLSTLAKLFTADIWVILDDVQFTRRDYQHRCLVAGPDTVERWLTDVSETSTKALLRALDWPGLIYRSSDLPARTGRSERLADLTLAVGASTYLCGTGGARYLDQQPFTTNGITVDHFRAPQPRQNITALSAFATAGPAKLATQLAEHASCWQPSPRRLPYAEGIRTPRRLASRTRPSLASCWGNH